MANFMTDKGVKQTDFNARAEVNLRAAQQTSKPNFPVTTPSAPFIRAAQVSSGLGGGGGGRSQSTPTVTPTTTPFSTPNPTVHKNPDLGMSKMDAGEQASVSEPARGLQAIINEDKVKRSAELGVTRVSAMPFYSGNISGSGDMMQITAPIGTNTAMFGAEGVVARTDAQNKANTAINNLNWDKIMAADTIAPKSSPSFSRMVEIRKQLEASTGFQISTSQALAIWENRKAELNKPAPQTIYTIKNTSPSGEETFTQMMPGWTPPMESKPIYGVMPKIMDNALLSQENALSLASSRGVSLVRPASEGVRIINYAPEVAEGFSIKGAVGATAGGAGAGATTGLILAPFTEGLSIPAFAGTGAVVGLTSYAGHTLLPQDLPAKILPDVNAVVFAVDQKAKSPETWSKETQKNFNPSNIQTYITPFAVTGELGAIAYEGYNVVRGQSTGTVLDVGTFLATPYASAKLSEAYTSVKGASNLVATSTITREGNLLRLDSIGAKLSIESPFARRSIQVITREEPAGMSLIESKNVAPNTIDLVKRLNPDNANEAFINRLKDVKATTFTESFSKVTVKNIGGISYARDIGDNSIWGRIKPVFNPVEKIAESKTISTESGKVLSLGEVTESGAVKVVGIESSPQFRKMGVLERLSRRTREEYTIIPEGKGVVETPYDVNMQTFKGVITTKTTPQVPEMVPLSTMDYAKDLANKGKIDFEISTKADTHLDTRGALGGSYPQSAVDIMTKKGFSPVTKPYIEVLTQERIDAFNAIPKEKVGILDYIKQDLTSLSPGKEYTQEIITSHEMGHLNTPYMVSKALTKIRRWGIESDSIIGTEISKVAHFTTEVLANKVFVVKGLQKVERIPGKSVVSESWIGGTDIQFGGAPSILESGESISAGFGRSRYNVQSITGSKYPVKFDVEYNYLIRGNKKPIVNTPLELETGSLVKRVSSDKEPVNIPNIGEPVIIKLADKKVVGKTSSFKFVNEPTDNKGLLNIAKTVEKEKTVKPVIIKLADKTENTFFESVKTSSTQKSLLIKTEKTLEKTNTPLLGEKIRNVVTGAGQTEAIKMGKQVKMVSGVAITSVIGTQKTIPQGSSAVIGLGRPISSFLRQEQSFDVGSTKTDFMSTPTRMQINKGNEISGVFTGHAPITIYKTSSESISTPIITNYQGQNKISISSQTEQIEYPFIPPIKVVDDSIPPIQIQAPTFGWPMIPPVGGGVGAGGGDWFRPEKPSSSKKFFRPIMTIGQALKLPKNSLFRRVR